jgi:catalase
MANEKLIVDLLAGLDRVNGGYLSGFRPAHAKGIFCSGQFTPSAAAAKLTTAPHANRASTPVTVRFSDFAGVPVVPDNDPMGASPRGMAIRFDLAPHQHTDIVAHSANGFPTRTGGEFLEFLAALAASGPAAAKPTPFEQYLSKNPKALAFIVMPKPIPTSFARETFFGVSALHFTNAAGATQFGRFRIRPAAGNEYLSEQDAAKKSPNFLMDEMPQRLAAGPVKFKIMVQLAAAGDVVDDATNQWPDDREEIEFGVVTIGKKENEQDPELWKIIFDPIPRVDGMEPSDDPLFQVRADIYLMSGRRRRKARSS